jgi:hypothetical protein
MSAATVGYWNFEEGTVDSSPVGPTTSGQWSGTFLDSSGNGYHASPFFSGTNTDLKYSSNVAAATVPQLGVSNTASLQNATSNFFSVSTTDNGNAGNPTAALSSWSPTSWTIEAAFNVSNLTGNKTIVGRDGRGVSNEQAAPLYFGTRGTNVAVDFQDSAGNRWSVVSGSGGAQSYTLSAASWYSMVATSDGSLLSLYVKNLTAGDTNFTLIGTSAITSLDASLAVGTGDGSDWDVGDFSVGRGLFNGGHVDRIPAGRFLDDIRFSDVALSSDQFLYTVPEPSGFGILAGSIGMFALIRRRRA